MGIHGLIPPLPDNLCQMVITASQIQWTADVSKCLATCKERGDKKYLKAMKKKQVRLPLRLSAPCAHPLTLPRGRSTDSRG